jgi:hypothetical protein
MPSSRTEYILVVPHPSEARVLLLPAGDGYALPRFETDEVHFWQTVDHINQRVLAIWGLRVTTLRCLKLDTDGDPVRRIYLLENHSAEWEPPPGAQWMDKAAIESTKLAEPGDRALITEGLTWYTDTTAARAEWYKPGWFGAVGSWVHNKLVENHITATGPLEQLRSWERSAILRIPTEQGWVYFKALPPMFRHEPALNRWLAYNFPENFPLLITVDGWRRWMLMPDYGANTLEKVIDIEKWQAALRRYGELQSALAPRTHELQGLGCPDRRLYHFQAQIEPFLNGDEARLSGDTLKLTADEVAALRTRIPTFKRWCNDLLQYSIPASIEHGDLWAGQVVMHGDHSVFIDWSDASVSHPFFSMLFLKEVLPPLGVTDAQAMLRNAYLEGWKAFEPMTRSIAAFELAQRLAPLHHAIHYYKHILPNMQFKWEMSNMVPFYLKQALVE